MANLIYTGIGQGRSKLLICNDHIDKTYLFTKLRVYSTYSLYTPFSYLYIGTYYKSYRYKRCRLKKVSEQKVSLQKVLPQKVLPQKVSATKGIGIKRYRFSFFTIFRPPCLPSRSARPSYLTQPNVI